MKNPAAKKPALLKFMMMPIPVKVRNGEMKFNSKFSKRLKKIKLESKKAPTKAFIIILVLKCPSKNLTNKEIHAKR